MFKPFLRSETPLQELSSKLHRVFATAGKLVGSAHREADGLALFYPKEPWYEENAGEMLRLLAADRKLYEEGLGLTRAGEISCIVTEPEWAMRVHGVAGLAMEDVILVSCSQRCLSEFAGVAAHELAHVLSRSAGTYEVPFKGEGFACYAAEVIDAAVQPCGIPLHYHLVWMLSVGLRPSLSDLWQRRDYTCELYDLAWSFTTFLIETHGLEQYYRFYAAVQLPMELRVREVLGCSATQLQHEWYAAAQAAVEVTTRAISRMHRENGVGCSRSAWLSGR